MSPKTLKVSGFFRDIKYVGKYPACKFKKRLLNDATEVVGDIKGHHSEHRDSSTVWSVFTR